MSFWDGLLTDTEAGVLATVEPSAPPPLAGPRVASLLLGYRCDLTCSYCLVIHQQAETVDTAAWKGAIDRLVTAGVRRISFSGGEPTLRPDLAQLVGHATGRGCLTSLVTNGMRLVDQLGALEDAGLRALTVSLDSADARIWQDVRGGGRAAHARILEGLRLARAHRRVWVGVNLVLSRASIPALPSLLDLCRDLGVALQVQPVNLMPGLPDLRPEDDEAHAAVALLVGARPPVTTSVEFLEAIPGFWRNGTPPFRCHVPDAEVVIAPDLGVQPCCVAGAVGKVAEIDTLWNGHAFGKWREKARSQSCRDCMLLYHDPPRSAQ